MRLLRKRSPSRTGDRRLSCDVSWWESWQRASDWHVRANELASARNIADHRIERIHCLFTVKGLLKEFREGELRTFVPLLAPFCFSSPLHYPFIFSPFSREIIRLSVHCGFLLSFMSAGRFPCMLNIPPTSTICFSLSPATFRGGGARTRARTRERERERERPRM